SEGSECSVKDTMKYGADSSWDLMPREVNPSEISECSVKDSEKYVTDSGWDFMPRPSFCL
ncbi:hypothetical protein AVEN_201131-1, partial [Araneus ventricosus]